MNRSVSVCGYYSKLFFRFFFTEPYSNITHTDVLNERELIMCKNSHQLYWSMTNPRSM